MGITAPLRAHPFFTGGGATSPDVPYRYPVSLDGRGYMIDTVMKEDWRHETVPLLRPQSDDSTTPGEASLNPDGLWRRSWSSWHKGAGQEYRDREDASKFRFSESRGVDIWDRYKLTLLNAVDQKRTTSNTNLKMVVAGSRLFLTDGASVVYTEDITVDSPTWTDCTNEPGGTILDIATNGEYVWICDGAASFWADASASPPAFNLAGWTGTQDADVLGFVKGRLMSGDNSTASLATYNAAGVATAVTIAATLPATWTWVGFAGGVGNSVIYAAGYVGDKSTIFRIGIKDDGSGLDVAIPAGELPDGEIIRSIGSYLGFVLLGTDNGVRFATPGSTGDLTIGALLETGSPCRCFEGQGPYVWFGWDTFNETVLTSEDWHGLGRLSLEEFSSAERLAPAYATDLMVANLTGGTSSVVTFQDRRVWCMEGTDQGVYGEQAVPDDAGYIQGGIVDFGFTGDKTAVSVEIAYSNPASGSIGVQVEVDDTGELSTTGTISTESQGTQEFEVGPLRGARFNIVIALVKGGSTSPTISSWTLSSAPAVQGSSKISVPLLLNSAVDPDGSVQDRDVEDDRNQLIGLRQTRQPFTYKELDRTHTVILEDYKWFPRLRDHPVKGLAVDGTMLVLLKEI